MSLVLDCSIALSWYLPDESNTVANDVLHAVALHGAVVPFIYSAEFSNSLLMAVRRKRIEPAFLEKVLEAFDALDIAQDDTGAKKCWPEGIVYCDRYGLTAYDATYLELAIRKRIPLATLDKKLVEAARAEGVLIFGQNG